MLTFIYIKKHIYIYIYTYIYIQMSGDLVNYNMFKSSEVKGERGICSANVNCETSHTKW